MQLSDIELALGAPASEERIRGSGVFAWADADGVVLFIGESSAVRTVMHRQELGRTHVIEALRERPRVDLAANGLASVLARADGLQEGTWPVPGADGRAALRDALVRLSAILGSTPAAQGADSVVWHELREGDPQSHQIISGWSHPDHPLQRLLPDTRAIEPVPEPRLPAARGRHRSASVIETDPAVSRRH